MFFNFFLTFVYLLTLCMTVLVCVVHDACGKLREQLEAMALKFQGPNSGRQTWCQAPLSDEPFYWLFFLN